jgi:TolA-binding protein
MTKTSCWLTLSFLCAGAAAAAPKKQEAAQEEERKAPASFRWTERSPTAMMDARADEKRDEAIVKLKELLKTLPEGPVKADLLFRLSEMYWAKAKFKRLVAMQTWDQALDAWHAGGQQGSEPKLDDSSALAEGRANQDDALALYRTILKDYPKYGRKDEVLYNMGSSLYEAGDRQEGVRKYWELIKQYPESDYAADAWLELGEHFFNSNKVTQAVRAYNKAAETKKPRIYSFALYKLAWCDYNLGEYDQALKKFMQVLEYSDKQADDSDMGKRDRIQLQKEALADMVRTYSHLDAVEEAFEFYTGRIGKEGAYKYLLKLSELYNNEGKHDLEIAAYRKLNEDYPYADSAPANQTRIMAAFAALDRRDDVRKEVRRLVDLYSPNGTWAKQNEATPRVLAQAFEVVEQELAGLVTEQHRAAQETKLAETYLLTRDIYKEYLDKFSTGENAYKFRFFYSEILFELKEFDAAAAQYDQVVASDRKGEFARHAGYAAILAWEKVVSGVKEEVGTRITEGKRGKQKGKLRELEQLKELQKGKAYDPTELSEAETKLAAACDTFVDVSPQDAEVVKVKFKSARLHYIHNQFEEAAKRFGEIIEKWPKDSLALVSAESIVMSFNVRQDWSNLNVWSRKFQGHKLLMADKGFAKTINQYVEGSTFNEVHFVFEPTESPAQIGDRYMAFVKEFPQSKFAMVGLYNSIINYDKANRLEKSLEAADLLLADYGKFKISDADLAASKADGAAIPEPDDVREKTLFLAASFRERLAEFAVAAGMYERYAKDYPKGPRRADALFNAGLLRDGLGEGDKAIENFGTYIKDFKDKDDAPTVAWRIGLIHEKRKDHRAAQSHFDGYRRYSSDKAQLLCAEYKSVQASLAQGSRDLKRRYEGVITEYKKLGDADRQKACPLEAVADATFHLLKPEVDEYLAIKLAGVNEKQLEKNLPLKVARVAELEGKLTQVLSIGQGDYGIAALYTIGHLYQHLAQEMFATECPRRLTEDQCMIYNAAVQEKAFPLEEKAIEAFDKALAKAYELGLYNEWLAKAQASLKTYEPGRFPDIRQYDLIASEAVFEVPQLVEFHR